MRGLSLDGAKSMESFIRTALLYTWIFNRNRLFKQFQAGHIKKYIALNSIAILAICIDQSIDQKLQYVLQFVIGLEN
jgi:hypothetical protein